MLLSCKTLNLPNKSSKDKKNIFFLILQNHRIGMCKDDTRIGRSLLNDMRQVEIDAMNMRVFRSDQVNVDSKTTSNIYQCFYALKTFVGFQNLLHNQSGVIDHSCVENLVES